MRLLLVLVFVFFSFPALAAKPPECKLLVMHKPAADVEYQPGVDVHGKPVVEADLSPPLDVDAKEVEIPITFDIAQSLGLDLPKGMETHTTVGVIKMKPDGSATFKGKPLNLSPDQALISVCEDNDAEAPAEEQKVQEKTGVKH